VVDDAPQTVRVGASVNGFTYEATGTQGGATRYRLSELDPVPGVPPQLSYSHRAATLLIVRKIPTAPACSSSHEPQMRSASPRPIQWKVAPLQGLQRKALRTSGRALEGRPLMSRRGTRPGPCNIPRRPLDSAVTEPSEGAREGRPQLGGSGTSAAFSARRQSQLHPASP
jgi:hypothetical protein